MKMFNVYVRNKLGYYHIVWSPLKHIKLIKVERIQIHFPSKVNGLKHLKYHESCTVLNVEGRGL